MAKDPRIGVADDTGLTIARIGLFFGDYEIIMERHKKGQKDGGDWVRRNRLKVYNLLSIRRFKLREELFIDGWSTFTATELIIYNDFVVLAVIAGVLALKQVDLKEEIIRAPEVNQVLPEVPFSETS
ncbi:hypothetical protein BDN72DRAFT_862405 [Pluteus cervinus]|uniref:Uncharacterized protein n=1 Tax=Pluteus cervinus TaxID=181527 RepID=A0ACD3ABB7_9AGAR|nr:hypothetical protein BDN72DRAFT_862405 [Pluteus cervinus]